MNTKTSAIILAGGEGKRMNSKLPKALAEVIFKPMIKWVIDSVREAGINDICVVTGSKHEFLENYLDTLPFETEKVFQSERLGTGHAVMQARDFLEKHKGSNVLVLNGDAPFINADTIKEAFALHNCNGCTVVSAEIENPTGYGRIIRENGDMLKAIVEEKEADDEIRKIKEVNSGVYWFEVNSLIEALSKIKKSAKTGEYYITDTIFEIKKTGKNVLAYKAKNADSVLGANDCLQLSQLNEIARKRILQKHLKNGVNIPCTDGVIIGTDVQIEPNTTILPSSVILGNTKIGSFCFIGPSAFIENCNISDNTHAGNLCLKSKNL